MSEDFAELFRSHAPFVWRVLRRYGVRAEELEDACQEVFLVVHRRHAEFQGRSSLRTWLYGIARKVAANSRRTRREHQAESALLPMGAVLDADPEADLDRTRSLHWLNAALGALDEDKREVFVLYELEFLTLAEVAEAVSCNETTALYRLEAARTQLRRAMKRRALIGGLTSAAPKEAP